jgi:hypothetical protein
MQEWGKDLIWFGKHVLLGVIVVLGLSWWLVRCLVNHEVAVTMTHGQLRVSRQKEPFVYWVLISSNIALIGAAAALTICRYCKHI